MKRGQKGFSTVEGLLVLIIILLIGFIGYYVYHTSKNANATYNSAAQTSASSPTVAAQPKTLDGATKQAQTVYDAAAEATTSSHAPLTSEWGKNNTWAYLDLQVVNSHKQWFTDKFVSSVNNVADNQLSASDGFLECVNTMFESMSVKGQSISGDAATVNVTENGQSSKTFPVHMVYQSGKWLVDSVDISSCS